MNWRVCLLRVLGLVVLPLVALVQSGCETSLPVRDAPPNQLFAIPELPGFRLPDLPAPFELVGPAGGQRVASYTESSLIESGAQFETDMPHQLVAASGPRGRFSPEWDQGATGLAYAVYEFGIEDFDRQCIFLYGFASAPVDYATIWFGFSDFARNLWNWRAADQTNAIALPALTQLESPTGRTYVVVAVTGNAEVDLGYLRFGPKQIVADLQAYPSGGVAPMDVTLNAAGSDLALGTIAKCEWDIDGDGIFDVDTGDSPTYVYRYEVPGSVSPAVRVTTDYGECDSDSDQVRLWAPWQHSWGTAEYERICDVQVDAGEEAVYAVGCRYGAAADLLVFKYTLAGDLLWCHTWDAPGQDAAYALDLDESSLYLCGQTDSFFAAGKDLLVQRWDRNGNVIWSRSVDYDAYQFDAAWDLDVHHDAIYVSGEVNPTSTIYGGDAVLLSFDLDGNLNWARAWGGADGDAASCVRVWTRLLGDVELEVAGWSRSYGDGEISLTRVTFNTAGTMTGLQSWGVPGTRTFPERIIPTGPLQWPYVIGTHCVDTTDYQPILLKLGGVEAGAELFGSELAGDAFGQALVETGDRTYIASYFSDNCGMLIRRDAADEIVLTRRLGAYDEGAQAQFEDLVLFPGSGGLLLGGSITLAAGQSLTYTEATQNAIPPQNWNDHPVEQRELECAISSPGAGHRDITSEGVVDSGGGAQDALLMAIDTVYN